MIGRSHDLFRSRQSKVNWTAHQQWRAPFQHRLFSLKHVEGTDLRSASGWIRTVLQGGPAIAGESEGVAPCCIALASQGTDDAAGLLMTHAPPGVVSLPVGITSCEPMTERRCKDANVSRRPDRSGCPVRVRRSRKPAQGGAAELATAGCTG